MAQMQFVEMIVTPEMAQRWLEKNPRNRFLKKGNYEYLKSQLMRNGQFELTHQAIAIAEDGSLVDGQHRLKAIIDTGISTKMIVCFNAPRKTCIDTGVRRREGDALFMAGITEKGSKENRSLTIPLVNFIIARSFGSGTERTISADEKHNVYLWHQDVIDKTIDIAANHTGQCSARSAAILYAIACALESGIPYDVLDKWHYILTTLDYYVPNDEKATLSGRSIILLSNAIMSSRATLRYAKNPNGIYIDTMVKKAMSSIRWYSKGVAITRLYGEICFPYIIITAEQFDAPIMKN